MKPLQEQKLWMYEKMVESRHFEDLIKRAYFEGKQPVFNMAKGPLPGEMHLSDGQSRRGKQNNPVFLPMSRGDIADYLGLTIETVSRTFTAFRKASIIELLDKSHARVIDWDALYDLAETE
mgnify:CR=1 FL=1